MTYELNFDLHSLGIVDWEYAELLQKILPVELIRRKSFEEFYVEPKELKAEVCMTELLELSEWFDVEIIRGVIHLELK